MRSLGSFGRTEPAQTAIIEPDAAEVLLRARKALAGTLLAHGNGRSYGDTCLNHGGTLVAMRQRHSILAFDNETGVIDVEAGVTLGEVIAHVAPHRWFPPVLPGTQHVTLGGAIANDVHGKNHHRSGTFGRHVLSLDLLRSDGRVYRISADSLPDLFAATVGGMGLTGIILSVRLRLMRVSSTLVTQTVTPFASIREYLALSEDADARNDYAVAWIDQLAAGGGEGRGLLLAGNHAPSGTERPTASARFSVPFQPPFSLLSRPALRAFNHAYRWVNGRKPGHVDVGHQSFFFPLDAIGNWNRLYGPRGLVQHQSVVPARDAESTLTALLAASRRAGHSSFLTVLKRFGDIGSPGFLSFPRPGYTLTLDFPFAGPPTLALLERLDRIAIEAGGAVNPYKHARMSHETFAASFPKWRALEAHRDTAFSSDFWNRVVLARGGEEHGALAAE